MCVEAIIGKDNKEYIIEVTDTNISNVEKTHLFFSFIFVRRAIKTATCQH